MNIYTKYFNKYKVLFFTAVSCVLIEALCDLMQPTIMAHIIDDGLKSGRMEDIIRYGAFMLIITALGAGFAAARSILAGTVSQNFGADLREDVFAKILTFSESGADKIESGSLVTRMTNDTAQITQFINGMMRIFFKAPVTCIGSIILAVVLSPRMSIILLSAVAVITVFIMISMKMSYARFARVQYAIDEVNSVVQEYLSGVRLVKAFGRYEDEEEKFGEANDNLSDRSVSSQLVISYFSPLMSLAVNISIVLILYFGSILFGKGDIEVGKVSAFITYMAQIMTSLLMITNVFNTFVRTKASTERIREVLDSEEDFSGKVCGGRPDYAELEFKNVTFAYPNGSGIPAVKGLSFEVRRGETLAVIGPTGSGKSTLAWLCLRFYDADGGTICFNGEDIRNLNPYFLRESVSLAPQKSMLFSGTVFENIAWGNPKASRDQIIAAAKAAHADDFISDMPDRYESGLGQAGVNLSGGQKQRLSIARALARKSPLLILDDCTSALDAVTERKVRRGITEMSGGTVILITQRVAAAMNADRILVLENGSRAGFGTHRELLASCKIYKDIFDSQIGEEFDKDDR